MSKGLAAQLEQPDLPVSLERAIAVVCPDNGIALNRRPLMAVRRHGNRNFLAALYIVGVDVILPLAVSAFLAATLATPSANLRFADRTGLPVRR